MLRHPRRQGSARLKGLTYGQSKGVLQRSGLNQLEKETEDWQRISGVIGRLLRLDG